jgi:hypothetical protein
MRHRVVPLAVAIFLLTAALANASQMPADQAAHTRAADQVRVDSVGTIGRSDTPSGQPRDRSDQANDALAPTLKLVATVVNEAGGSQAADDWTLSATAAAPKDGHNFSHRGSSGVFEAVYADAAYLLAATGPAGYVAGAWSCTGGSLAGSTLTLGEGDLRIVCTITGYQPTGKITPAGTTCRDFKTGAARDLTRALYATRRGAINSVAPGVLTYYSKLTAMPASFTIQVKETRSPAPSWPWLPPQTTGQVVLYDAACNKSRGQGATGYDAVTGAITVKASGAAGATYYLGIKYKPAAVKGTGLTTPYPVVTYRFLTWIDGGAMISSQAGLDLVFKK